MKKHLLSTLFFLSVYVATTAQDSLYYFPFWKPAYQYVRSGVKQEGIFRYYFRDNNKTDSLLIQTNAFDTLGRLIRQQNFYHNQLRSRFNLYYTGNRLDSALQEEIWLRDTVVYRYSYNAQGNLSLQHTFNNGQPTTQTRFVYNNANQPVQVFTSVGKGKEELTAQYSYRTDRLVRQVDVYFPKDPFNNYSLYYTYANGTHTVTCSFQRINDNKRLIDYIRTYNDNGQLLEEIHPPLRLRDWLPPGYHPRPEEEKRHYVVGENGLLYEKKAIIENRIIWIEKHVYL